jgi:uncharacterized membrane protein
MIMKNRFSKLFKPLLKTLFLVGLVLTLAFGPALGHGDDALAASRGGGRMGGGSFRSAPSRGYSSPSRSSRSAYGGSYGGGYGGGFGGGGFFMPSPFIFLGGGGGSLLTLLVIAAVGSYLFQTFRGAMGGEDGNGMMAPTVAVAKLQVGLLADARTLQADLDKLALKANTGSTAGLTQVLQETTLSLLRHPEYWAYAGGEAKQAKLESAEIEFNRFTLSERSKFSSETLSNVNSQLKQSAPSALAVAAGGGAVATTPDAEPGEYIVVTLVVGAQGKINLPKINGAADVYKALQELGAISSDRLLALEVLWSPQASGEVLTSEDMLTDYPSLKLV